MNRRPLGNPRRLFFGLEKLEQRALFASDLTAILSGGVLSIFGTSGNDSITVVSNGSWISIWENGKSFPASSIRQIQVQGLAGNDSIYNDTIVPMVADGGNGADFITGGAGIDIITGGDGNDFIRGRGANDSLFGGVGDDKLYSDLDDRFEPGRAGSDLLSGEAGNDTLDGSTSIDYFSWSNQSLIVNGSENSDTLTFRWGNGQTSMDGMRRTWQVPMSVQLNGGGGNDAIYNDTNIVMIADGGAGNDVITGGGLSDTLNGGDGNDYLRGRGANDTILGGPGDDILYSDLENLFESGRSGSDLLRGDAGNDLVDGSSFVDVIQWEGDSLYVGGTEFNDTITVRWGNGRLRLDSMKRDWILPSSITIHAGSGDDTVYNDTNLPMTAEGGSGNDFITGGGESDVLRGGDGNDYMRGRGGNDLIYGGSGNDRLYSDLENSFEHGRNGSDLLSGDRGDDVLDKSTSLDYFSWENATLVISGSELDDRLMLRWGNGQVSIDGVDRSWLVPASIQVNGGDGNDTIYNDTNLPMDADGGTGNDTITGGGLNDTLNGGPGNDHIRGRGGDDRYVFGVPTISEERDQIEEMNGEGHDVFDFSQLPADNPVNVDLQRLDSIASHLGRTVFSLADVSMEEVVGGAGNDTICGNALDNILRGGAGDDHLEGREGDDQLFGDVGWDSLLGGVGSDWLEAGSADEFADGGDEDDFNAHQWAIDKATFDDVHQRLSGTCWFLASLSAASQHIDFAQRIQYLGNFQFAVGLNVSSDFLLIPSTVVVTFDGHRSGADADVVRGYPSEDYWVLLFNRAMLQVRGISYQDIEAAKDSGGHSVDALAMLTGRPVSEYSGSSFFGLFQDPIDLYAQTLRDALDSGFSVVAETGAESRYFVPDHCYTILSIDPQGIVTVRNPWGRDGKLASGSATDGLIQLHVLELRDSIEFFTYA